MFQIDRKAEIKTPEAKEGSSSTLAPVSPVSASPSQSLHDEDYLPIVEASEYDRVSSKNIDTWSVEDVSVWLRGVGVLSKKIHDVFRKMHIDGNALLLLNEAMLRDELNVTEKINIARILQKIQNIRQKGASSPSVSQMIVLVGVGVGVGVGVVA